MKLILYIVIGSILFSCTTSLKNVKNKINSPERKRYEKNMTVVNQKALDDKVILYYGSAYGMTPTQAYNKAQESALIEMASSLATFVVSNSSQEIYEKSGTAYVINKLRDKIYTMNIIVDYQVVKYNEIEELGAYRCKVFISYSSEAARIIASERSNDILQSILNDTSDENKKSKSESISVQPADNKIDLIDFDETGFSDKEITNLIFARYIERLVPDYEINCFNDTLFVADLPVASGFFIKDNVIIPNRFTEDQPVFATPLGADIFVKILSRSHFPSFEEIRFSLLSVEDYNSLYNDLGTRPYITGYIFNGEKNEPNIKFIMKFYSSRINLNNTLMEFYSKADTFGNFYIKKTF